jgi:tetratricopeptide (TPR) repeat protein
LLHAILLLQLAVTPPEANEAEKLVHASIQDYDLGSFDKALDEAEQAYRLDPLPQILFNIAQCHRALKHWEQAAFFYRRYLLKLPAAPNRRTVDDLLTEATYRAKAAQLPAPKAGPAPSLNAELALEQAPGPKPILPDTPLSAPAAAVSEAPPPTSHSHWLGAWLPRRSSAPVLRSTAPSRWATICKRGRRVRGPTPTTGAAPPSSWPSPPPAVPREPSSRGSAPPRLSRSGELVCLPAASSADLPRRRRELYDRELYGWQLDCWQLDRWQLDCWQLDRWQLDQRELERCERSPGRRA